MGFSIVSETAGGLHLAHGAVMVIAGLMALSLAPIVPGGIGVAVVGGIVTATLVGLVIERAVYGPLAVRRSSPSVLLLAALGVNLVLTGGMAIVFGVAAVYPDEISSFRFAGSNATASSMQITQIGLGASLVLLIGIGLIYTRTGALLRAQTDDPDLLRVLRGPTKRIRLFGAVLGGGLAGIAGVLLGLDVGIDANYGLAASVTAAVACLLAGEGLSAKPAFWGVTIGLLQATVGAVVPEKWQVGVTYALLLLFLASRASAVARQTLRKAVS